MIQQCKKTTKRYNSADEYYWNSAYFYTIVTQNSMEQDFALNRQMFLTEQGYEYRIERFNP